MYFIEFYYEFVSFTFPFHLNRNLMGSRYETCASVCVFLVWRRKARNSRTTVDRINNIYAFYIFYCWFSSFQLFVNSVVRGEFHLRGYKFHFRINRVSHAPQDTSLRIEISTFFRGIWNENNFTIHGRNVFIFKQKKITNNSHRRKIIRNKNPANRP